MNILEAQRAALDEIEAKITEAIARCEEVGLFSVEGDLVRLKMRLEETQWKVASAIRKRRDAEPTPADEAALAAIRERNAGR